ncbi:unnamed protein product [Rotaria sordida]|uniref:Uncharacterized protein n=2 Tax=Rotaria sordida TaxID=392033 RepID=A0A814DRI1_9BILA|nr:unnamed protein product [Rotaria sordida]CAF0755636.1 unnamed protein product [Rotaria sordida]CAF0957584.1 unnamed protein product [Rotaria sordida]CAF3472322.1 unnamed protein product [Rotaria sordida]
MSELGTSRHCWSWRSCFAAVKHNKRKMKKQQNLKPYQEKVSPNGHIHNKPSHTVDENSNILYDTNLSSKNTISNEYNQHLISNMNNNVIDDHNIQQTIDGINSIIINQKSSSSTIRTTQLDVIVEDSNEENSDDGDETIQPIRLCHDSDLINDFNDLYIRLFDLSKMKHIIKQFNDNDYLFDEFIRQIGKLKLKIDDIKRARIEIPRHAELLEARYSTLLATIESLSLLLKIGQISTFHFFINNLICSIEQRIEQLNRYIKLSSSINLRQQRQDLNDDDFLSFRSALSSYEHLLIMSS